MNRKPGMMATAAPISHHHTTASTSRNCERCRQLAANAGRWNATNTATTTSSTPTMRQPPTCPSRKSDVCTHAHSHTRPSPNGRPVATTADTNPPATATAPAIRGRRCQTMQPTGRSHREQRLLHHARHSHQGTRRDQKEQTPRPSLVPANQCNPYGGARGEEREQFEVGRLTIGREKRHRTEYQEDASCRRAAATPSEPQHDPRRRRSRPRRRRERGANATSAGPPCPRDVRRANRATAAAAVSGRARRCTTCRPGPSSAPWRPGRTRRRRTSAPRPTREDE